MITEAQKAIRNVGLLMVQRGSHIIAGMLFAVLLPRMMGPDIFGRYALIMSLSYWFSLLSGMGALSMMSHFVPKFVLSGDRAGLEKLVSNLLVLRITNGLAGGCVYFLLTYFWLQELDWLSIVFIAGTICLRTGANLFYKLFLGLNQAAKWGMGEFLRRWLSLIFLVSGFYLAGLRGSCFGLLLTELIIFIIGFWFSRSYIKFTELRIDRKFLKPFLQFSALFFASNFLITISQRSGEMLVRITSGSYQQVAYYGVAYGIFYSIGLVLWHFNIAFSPLMMIHVTKGETSELRNLVERLLKLTAMMAIVILFGLLLLGENLIPLVLGKEYRSVTINLIPLILSYLTMALTNAGRLLALTYNRPGTAFRAALLNVVVFWGVGAQLSYWPDGLTGSLSVLLASIAQASYYTWAMRRDLAYSLRDWLIAIITGLIFLPLLWMRGSLVINISLYLFFLAGYGSLLLWCGIIRLQELTALKQTLISGKKKRNHEGHEGHEVSELKKG